MRISSVVLVGICVLSAAVLRANEVVVKSPDGALTMTVGIADGGQLTYDLARRGQAIVESSPLGITIDDTRLGRGATLGSPQRSSVDETYATRGVHAIARNHYHGATTPVTHRGTETLYV
ncbi:MAG: glycoside hydrolase family 97 N-terminal domain-containing protein, partial [Planctomycetota bacterium]